MEPSTTPDYSGENAVKIVTKSSLLMICDPLCHPTSVSKILAAVIFIILPFIGAYVGYQMAGKEMTEVYVDHVVSKKNSDSRLSDQRELNVHSENEYGFSFSLPSSWNVTDIGSSTELFVPTESIKNLLVKKNDESKAIIISIVPKNNLGSLFGCYRYIFEPTANKWVRQNTSVTDRCGDEENVKSAENQFLNPNYSVAGNLALKNMNISPATVLVPLLSDYGLNIAVVDWKGDSNVGEIDQESQQILDSLTQM